jgi:hypothetical protein
MRDLDTCQCRVLKVDRVVGEFDIIAQLEAPDIDCLGGAITDGIQELAGVVSVAAVWCIDACADRQEPIRQEQSLVSAA